MPGHSAGISAEDQVIFDLKRVCHRPQTSSRVAFSLAEGCCFRREMSIACTSDIDRGDGRRRSEGMSGAGVKLVDKVGRCEATARCGIDG
jgi:hypothetical protein